MLQKTCCSFHLIRAFYPNIYVQSLSVNFKETLYLHACFFLIIHRNIFRCFSTSPQSNSGSKPDSRTLDLAASYVSVARTHLNSFCPENVISCYLRAWKFCNYEKPRTMLKILFFKGPVQECGCGREQQNARGGGELVFSGLPRCPFRCHFLLLYPICMYNSLILTFVIVV
jgi:hypothetical protein